jgi:hypothetical protein
VNENWGKKANSANAKNAIKETHPTKTDYATVAATWAY